MITRALDAGTPAGWVAGDEVYGGDPGLRAGLERRCASLARQPGGPPLIPVQQARDLLTERLERAASDRASQPPHLDPHPYRPAVRRNVLHCPPARPLMSHRPRPARE
jgi:hypothetical protein